MDYLRFRYRRQVRRIKRDLRTWRRWSANYIDRHVWGKWHHLGANRRFLLVWGGVVAIGFVGVFAQYRHLTGYNNIVIPEAGGSYIEASSGDLKVLNPILPGSNIENSANRLIFNGLTQYDSDRKLVGDLATKWEMSTDGKTYTFYLRKGVKWQDGVPFSSTDVAFTLAAIQNPDSRSPLASSWQGVKVEAKGDDVVVFTLPSPLDSFMDSTTIGIIPRHILESVDPSQLADAAFNRNPVGTGPFQLKSFSAATNEVTLTAYKDYYAGKPKLDEFILRSYASTAAALDAFTGQRVTSPGRILPDVADRADKMTHLQIREMTLPNVTAVFFNNSVPLFASKDLRLVLSRTLDRAAISAAATNGEGIVVDQPLLPGQLGYTDRYAPAELTPDQARKALNDAGWVLPAGKTVREKAGQKLEFQLATVNASEYERAAAEISRQLGEIGVKVTVKSVDLTDLQQSYMRPRNFQAVLFGMNLGSDPDVYSFWHSSQVKDPGINLSGYASAEADKALESGRIKSDAQVRQGKYYTFLRVWNADAPAAVLYQTGYDYGTLDTTRGITAKRLVMPTDRYYQVEKWTIRTRWVSPR